MVGTSLERFGRRMIWGHGGKDGRVSADGCTPSLALTAAVSPVSTYGTDLRL